MPRGKRKVLRASKTKPSEVEEVEEEFDEGLKDTSGRFGGEGRIKPQRYG